MNNPTVLLNTGNTEARSVRFLSVLCPPPGHLRVHNIYKIDQWQSHGWLLLGVWVYTSLSSLILFSILVDRLLSLIAYLISFHTLVNGATWVCTLSISLSLSLAPHKCLDTLHRDVFSQLGRCQSGPNWARVRPTYQKGSEWGSGLTHNIFAVPMKNITRMMDDSTQTLL